MTCLKSTHFKYSNLPWTPTQSRYSTSLLRNSIRIHQTIHFMSGSKKPLKGRPHRWLHEYRTLPPSLMTWVQSPEPTHCKEKQLPSVILWLDWPRWTPGMAEFLQSSARSRNWELTPEHPQSLGTWNKIKAKYIHKINSWCHLEGPK